MEYPELFVISYIVALVSIIYFKKDEYTLTFILAILFSFVMYQTKYQLVGVLVLSLMFCIIEYICVDNGVWKYNYARKNIPTWLYFAWAMSVVFIIKVYHYISN